MPLVRPQRRGNCAPRRHNGGPSQVNRLAATAAQRGPGGAITGLRVLRIFFPGPISFP